MIRETREWRVAVGAEETSAVYERAGGDTLFVCAHGAGGSMSDRGVLATAKVLLARGIDVVRFNFLYKEKRSGRPARMTALASCSARARAAPTASIIGRDSAFALPSSIVTTATLFSRV